MFMCFLFCEIPGLDGFIIQEQCSYYYLMANHESDFRNLTVIDNILTRKTVILAT